VRTRSLPEVRHAPEPSWWGGCENGLAH
jgi:hypothetical protein